MNPITESWNGLGGLIWKRRIFGGWKRRAQNLEGELNGLRKQVCTSHEVYASGWRAGFHEALSMAQIDVTFHGPWINNDADEN